MIVIDLNRPNWIINNRGQLIISIFTPTNSSLMIEDGSNHNEKGKKSLKLKS